MNKLGSILKIVDDQSELLKSLIEEAWAMDRKRRDVAQKNLLNRVEGDGVSANIEPILAKWKQNEQEIMTAQVESPIIVEMDKLIRDYENLQGLSLEFCRVVCLYALTRLSRDRNDFALEYVDEWVSGLDRNEPERRNGLVFMCNALMAMGEYEECLERSKEVIEISEKEPIDLRAQIAAHLNQAYYLSEAFYHRAFDEPWGAGERDTEETEDCRVKALAIIDTWRLQAEKEQQNCRLLDTIGAVLIACGQESQIVKEGLELCRRTADNILASADASHSHDLFKSFFALHERRAFKKLAEFE